MMNTAYSKRQYKILKYLYPNKEVDVSKVEEKFDLDDGIETLRKLQHDHLVTIEGYRLSNGPVTVRLQEVGKVYVEERKRETSRFWISSIVAPIIVAFVTSLLTNWLL